MKAEMNNHKKKMVAPIQRIKEIKGGEDDDLSQY
jgi:hypothetical protein